MAHCPPKLNPKGDPAKYLSDKGAPWAKLANEKPKGETIAYDSNVFRLSGRYDEAAFIRELFDEPTTILYQAWSLIGTLDNATAEGSSIPIDAVRAQADTLILEVVAALEGDGESEIVASLLSLTKALQSQPPGTARTAEVEGAKDRMINVINTFFRDKLTSVPSIDEYIAGIQSG